MREIDQARLLLGLKVNDPVLWVFDVHEALEPRHELGVRTDKSHSSLHKYVAINEIGGVQVAELEKFVEGLLVADKLLHPVKEGKFVVVGSQRESWWNRFRECRHKSG
jgi:hypothetical protein